MPILVDKTVIFFAEFPWKKEFSSQWRIIGFVFVQKCEHHDLSWKPAIQVTVWPWCWWPFFSNWFLLNIEEYHFNCLFLIICRWNLFRTICANSRKVGLGKFLSPYKGIPVDLSRPEPHPHFFMFAHWSAMQERSIINACRFYSLQWLLHMYV